MSVRVFDQQAEYYDRWYDEPAGRLAFEIELRAIRPMLSSLPEPWLEVGVGTGRFAQALGIKTGVDPAARMLELAGRRGIETIRATAESLPFASGAFGTVFLLTTWEFLSQPEAALREIGRVLKPEGVLVNAYLDRDGKWGRSYIAKAEAGHPIFSCARFYSYEEVVRLTEGCGFRIEQTVSTLFQGPDEINELEEPKPGYQPGASFVVLVARKGFAP